MSKRLHIYSTNEPDGQCYVVGDKSALLQLAKSLQHAANNEVDFKKYYSGDGHRYTVIAVRESDDEVWPMLKTTYTDPVFAEQRNEYVDPENLEVVDFYLQEKHKLK